MERLKERDTEVFKEGLGGKQRVARFRLRNEISERIYWEREKKRACRLCGRKRETWEYVWEECRDLSEGEGSWQEAMGWVLGEEWERGG